MHVVGDPCKVSGRKRLGRYHKFHKFPLYTYMNDMLIMLDIVHKRVGTDLHASITRAGAWPLDT